MSSRSRVPWAMPRDRCERSLTHSKKAATPSSAMPSPWMRCISSHVALIASHISEVMEPRMARAFSRAAKMLL